jgi:hypothetical protein
MSNSRRLRKPKKRTCRQCAAGNHTGHEHKMCPVCQDRLEPGKPHVHIAGGAWVSYGTEATR